MDLNPPKVPVSSVTSFLTDSFKAHMVANSVRNMYSTGTSSSLWPWGNYPTYPREPTTLQPTMMYEPPKKKPSLSKLKSDYSKQEISMLQTINEKQKEEIRDLRQKLLKEERCRAVEKAESELALQELQTSFDFQINITQKLMEQRKRAKKELQSVMRLYECE